MSAIAPAARLRAHLRVPMFRDGYALVASGLITGVVGVAYWVAAAHRYSAENVGLSSAAISAMTLIAGVAQLNLASALIRFVPVAGRTTFRLVLGSYLTSIAVAGVLSAVFLLGGVHFLPSFHVVDESAAVALLFVGSTMTWCVFVLQDAVLTGLRQAVWVPVENAAFSVVKLVLLVAFASAFPRHGIFSSWALGAVVTLVPVTVLIFARLVPRQQAAAAPEPAPTLRELGRYVAPDYLGALGWLAAVTVVPLIVTARLGAEQNAYFALAWVIVLPIFFVSANMGSSLVVSGVVSDPRLLPSHLRRMLVQTAMLVLPMVAVVEVGAPWLLRIFGGAYSEHGTTVLRLLALSTVPHVLIALAINAARVRRRMRIVVAVQVAECACVLGLTWALVGPYGIEGAGWAWLIGQVVVAAAVALWALPGVRPAVGRRRDALAARAQLRRLRPVLAEIDAVPARLLAPSATDAIVVAAGGRAVKVAHTEAGARSLAREIAVLRRLAADPRLDGWRDLLPEIVAAGRTGGHVYLVQGLASGVDARARVGDPALLDLAAAAIGGLHRRTAEEQVVGDELLERWVDRPLCMLDGAAGAEAVRARLRGALAGRTLTTAWIHGDFVPGNLLVGESGATGIVDWDRATPGDLPVLDLLQFVLARRLAAEGGELGAAVTSFVPSAAEREVLADALELDLDDAVLLCWLRHVSSNLEKSARYRASRAWFRANVTAVLDEVAR